MEYVENKTARYTGLSSDTKPTRALGVNVYDNIAASGTLLTSPIDTAKTLGTLTFGSPFSVGLTVVTAGGAKVTVVYE